MKHKLLILSFAVLFFTSCRQGRKEVMVKEAEGSENIQEGRELVSKAEKFRDSLKGFETTLQNIEAEKMTREQWIVALLEDRDSVLSRLKRIEASVNDIKDNKLVPGLHDVNVKLDELKSVEEDLIAETELKQEEIRLAAGKIDILKKEKEVYDKQRQALFDKGEAPEMFVRADSLLNAIDRGIAKQNFLINNLQQEVSDNELKIKRIKSRRKDLSHKIRKNYDTQQVLSEYNKGEIDRLEALVAGYERQINELSEEATGLNTDYNILQGKVSNIRQQTEDSLQDLNDNELAQQNDQPRVRETGHDYLGLGFISIIIVFIVMVILYIVGKKNKVNKRRVHY